MSHSPKSLRSASCKTRQRILRAAERIFAQEGYRAMTLRDVTSEAKVNLAAVNYHFGSKRKLMMALFRDRFEPINQQRLALLAERIDAHAPEPVPLDEIFDALFRPLFAGIESTPAKESIFMQLIGRALTEPADFMRGMHKELFTDLSKRFIEEIRRTCPEIPEKEVYYRFYLSVSAMLGTMIEQIRLENISDGKLQAAPLDTILNELTAFVVAGFQQK